MLLLYACAENIPPTIEIIRPTGEEYFNVDNSITIQVNAEDEDGTITEVRLLIDGEEYSILKEKPFILKIPAYSLGPGEHLIKATAYDDEMMEASTEVLITCGIKPTVITGEVSEIRDVSAIISATVSAGSSPFKKGVYYGTNPISDTLGRLKFVISDYINYDVRLTNLEPATTYFYSAYVSNSFGESIGEEHSFKTLSSLPIVSTYDVTNITENAARSGGYIDYSPYLPPILEKGVCWSLNQNPTIEDSKTSDGSGPASYYSSISPLEKYETYFVRAYARNENGIGYGNEEAFTTRGDPNPRVITNAVSDITDCTAMCYGSVNEEGKYPVSESGFCWSTHNQPTINDDYLVVSSGLGDFNTTLTDLEAHTRYYVRAFATNQAGTSYGQVLGLTTNGPPRIVTSEPWSIDSVRALVGGRLSDFEKDKVTETGVYFGTSADPVSFGVKNVIATETGKVSMQMTGLIPGETYYVVAFAQNSYGTSYGEQHSFDSNGMESEFLYDIEGNTYRTVKIDAQWWMCSNLMTTKYNDGSDIPFVDGVSDWKNNISDAYCWGEYEEIDRSFYGALYNFAAVDSGKLCPTGWHVPSTSEWRKFESAVSALYAPFGYGGDWIVGGLLKEQGTEHWDSPNKGAKDIVGFKALPAGHRYAHGVVEKIGAWGSWWTSTPAHEGYSDARMLYSREEYISRHSSKKNFGLSVRCVKDD